MFENERTVSVCEFRQSVNEWLVWNFATAAEYDSEEQVGDFLVSSFAQCFDSVDARRILVPAASHASRWLKNLGIGSEISSRAVTERDALQVLRSEIRSRQS